MLYSLHYFLSLIFFRCRLCVSELGRDLNLGSAVLAFYKRVGWTTDKGALNLLYALLTPTPPGAYIAVWFDDTHFTSDSRAYFIKPCTWKQAFRLEHEQERNAGPEGLEGDGGSLASSFLGGGRYCSAVGDQPRIYLPALPPYVRTKICA
ncbi:hypothetical protein B0H10DRAFT_1064528 [Mycena sp. CBHHK59/15]|nr:hypothetical protein B0H10DRAFT_1064528 [Mycena sp. CBHHK59/15]